MIDEPMSPIMFEDNDGDDDNGQAIIRMFYVCPNCNKGKLIPYENRCPECEQKLKW